MSKFRALLISGLAFIMSLILLGPLAAPAGAAYTPIVRIAMGVNTTTPLLVDNWVVFQRQADGTGVNLQWTGPSIVAGCNTEFETSGSKLYSSYVSIYDGNSGNYITGLSYPNTSSCQPTWDIARNGYDEGYVNVVVATVARLQGSDVWLEWRWHLWPSGNSQLQYAGWTYY